VPGFPDCTSDGLASFTLALSALTLARRCGYICKRVDQCNPCSFKIRDIARDQRHAVLQGGGGDHDVTFGFGIGEVHASAQDRRVLGERQYAVCKRIFTRSSQSRRALP